MENNRGVSIISFILVICILSIIAFLGYQIFYEDILNMGVDTRSRVKWTICKFRKL